MEEDERRTHRPRRRNRGDLWGFERRSELGVKFRGRGRKGGKMGGSLGKLKDGEGGGRRRREASWERVEEG